MEGLRRETAGAPAARDRTTPFIGRPDFVASLAGERAAVICAEPGAGKSRLLAELRAIAPEPVVATVRCHRGVVSTLEPLEALADVAARAVGGTMSARHNRFQNDTDRLVAVRERFEALADEAPLLLQIDDVHWAPATTLDAIAFCIDRTRDCAIRWQITTRPHTLAAEALRREPDCRIVDLPLLGPEQTTELALALGGEPDAGLHALTGGNPLYIEQVLIAQTRPQHRSTLRAILEMRLSEIPDRGAGIASLVAAAERPLTVAELSRALSESPDEVRANVADLEALGILRTDDDNVSFVHDLLRGACIGMLDDSRGTLAREMLLTVARDDVERGTLLTALGRNVEAATAYLQAARAALTKLALLEVSEIARRLRELAPPSPAVRWQMAALDRILWNSRNGFPEDRAGLEAFLDGREAVDSATGAFYLEYFFAVVETPGDHLGPFVLDTLLAAPDIDRADKGPFYSWRAKLLHAAGDFEEGYDLVERALEEPRMPAEYVFELRCMRGLFASTRSIDEGRTTLVTLAEDPANRALPNYSFVYLVLAKLEQSCDDQLATIRWAKIGLESGDDTVGPLFFYLVTGYVNSGRLADALEVCDASQSWCFARGISRKPALIAMHVEAYAWLGDFANARALIGATDDFARNPRLAYARASLAEHEEALDVALGLFTGVAAQLADSPESFGALALTAIVRIGATHGDVAEARGAYERLIAGTSQTELSWNRRAECDFYLALGAGDEAEARRCLASFDQARVPVLDAARALAHFGKRFAERPSLIEATTTFERCGAVVLAERTKRIAHGFGFRFGSKSSAAGVLTGRESAIAHLIAAGKTNREIADELHVSPKTIAANVGAMLERYGLRSRVEIAANVAAGKPFERV